MRCTARDYFFINMVKKLRFSIANGLFRDKKSLKGIAFVLFFYHRFGQNVLKRWSYNKLATITGVHACTIKKRIDTLRQLGYVNIEGSSLIFRSVVSKHTERNINITNICYDTLKDVEKSLYAILLCIVQSHKDFCRRTILQARESRRIDVVKKARSIKRRYGYEESYRERGLSYKRIAQKFGVSLKTAFDYVKFAVKNGFVTLQNHFYATFMPLVGKYPVPGFMFTTHDYAYNVTANTYTITSNIFSFMTTRDSRGAHIAWLY